MNGLDVVIIVAAVLAAVGGWRLGFLTRSIGWLGAGIGLALAVVVLQLQILKDVSEFFTGLATSGVLILPAGLNPAKYERLIFGLILVLMCIFRPKGLLPEKRFLSFKRHGEAPDKSEKGGR